MHTIIKVPSVYSVKLPGSEWLNLALRRPPALVKKIRPLPILLGRTAFAQVYHHEKAIAIAQAWAKTLVIDKSHITVRHEG